MKVERGAIVHGVPVAALKGLLKRHLPTFTTVDAMLAFAIVEVSGPVASHAVLLTADASPEAVLKAWTDLFRWHDAVREAWVGQLGAFQDRARELLLAPRGTVKGSSGDGTP